MFYRIRRIPLVLVLHQLAFLSLTVLALTSVLARADVIYFTNGSVLIVEKAWQEGDLTKFQTSQGIQTTPSSTVRKIEVQKPADGPQTHPPRYGIAVSESSPVNDMTGVIRTQLDQTSASHPISTEALRQLRNNLASEPNNVGAKKELIQALNAVAVLATSQGDFGAARSSLQEALKLDRQNPIVLSHLGIVEYRMGNFRAAEEFWLSALSSTPNNQTLHLLLAEAYYAQDKLAEAINQWSDALQLGPNPDASARLEAARRELGVHKTLGTLQSAHFILRYDREVSDYRLGQQVLTALEELYRQLSNELVSQPPATIAVIVYPDQTYFNITEAPAWTGALFDGKIRLPTKGLTSVTPELSSILIHELTHSFLESLPGAGIPAWFNEGLAQFEERKSTSKSLQKQGRHLPLKNLRGSFARLSAYDAGLAYMESLSAVEYLTGLRGKSVIRGILDLMAKNYTFETAFRSITQMTVSQFETSWDETVSQ